MGQFIYGKPGSNTPAGPTTILPTDLASLVGWYRADGIGGLSDADPVGTWSDESGASNDLTSSGANRPTYKTSIKNTLPVVRFDGIDDYMTNTSLTPTSAGTFLVVVNCKTDTSGQILGYSDTATNNDYLGFQRTTSNLLLDDVVSGATETSATYSGFTDNAWAIITVSSSGTAYAQTWNGQTFAWTFGLGSDDGDWWSDVAGGDTFAIGALVRSTIGVYQTMDVAELILFSDQKTGSDLTDLILYLNQKWAVY